MKAINANLILNFISSELVTYIDSYFPASSERCIIGHSAGGLFAIYALENQPELFGSFFCIDPSLWYEEQSYVKKIRMSLFQAKLSIQRLNFLALGFYFLKQSH